MTATDTTGQDRPEVPGLNPFRIFTVGSSCVGRASCYELARFQLPAASKAPAELTDQQHFPMTHDVNSDRFNVR
jgi:hypothetical protein